MEILGYQHIAAIADKRFYADAVRSIEYSALSRFFARGAQLPSELCDYFVAFDLIVSYLYDPGGIFEQNLRRCGVEDILRGPSKIGPGTSAAKQLAQPLQELGVKVTDLASKIFPSAQDVKFAGDFLNDCTPPILAVHPGSGSETKNWPIENWIELIKAVLREATPSVRACFPPGPNLRAERLAGGSNLFRSILVVSGEADNNAMQRLRPVFENDPRVRFAHALPLPHLAAVLSQLTFIGHDSGISHLAAAAGARSILLFGPTDPDVWAPQNKAVTILIAPEKDMTQLTVATARDAIMR